MMNNMNMNNPNIAGNINMMNNNNMINNGKFEQNMNLINEINKLKNINMNLMKEINNQMKNQNVINNQDQNSQIKNNSKPNILNNEQKNESNNNQKKEKNGNKNEIPKLKNAKINKIIDFSETRSVVYSKKKSESSQTCLKFTTIKNELSDMVNKIISKFLNKKVYDAEKAQSWCNSISDEIIKTLHQQQRGFKFICATTIFQKGDCSLHFSSTCLWNQDNDGSTTIKFENDHMHCFVSLFGIIP